MSSGLHHITAMASDPKRNLDFYTNLLGLRLVKKTVNFDDPGTYHLYYADAEGSPGSVLTFFPYGTHARRGRPGAGQAVGIGFRIPEAALAFWIGRLHEHNIAVETPVKRFDETVVAFEDPDGLKLELITSGETASGTPWATADIKIDHAIRGFHSVTLWEQGFEATAKLLTDVFDFHEAGREGDRFRFKTGDGIGGIVDICCKPHSLRGAMGAGVNHHVAFRSRDDAHQAEIRETLFTRGFNVTPVLDRQYFHSIYFREPGGVLFEIATDPPGFTVDEPLNTLGTTLKLPPQYERDRARIEAALSKLD